MFVTCFILFFKMFILILMPLIIIIPSSLESQKTSPIVPHITEKILSKIEICIVTYENTVLPLCILKAQHPINTSPVYLKHQANPSPGFMEATTNIEERKLSCHDGSLTDFRTGGNCAKT